jgi:hypothetical protein
MAPDNLSSHHRPADPAVMAFLVVRPMMMALLDVMIAGRMCHRWRGDE